MHFDQSEIFKNTFNQASLDNSSDMYYIINEPLIPLSETLVSSRNFHNWKSNNLIFNQPEDRKRVKISFVEYIWLRTIDTLRNFGMSLKLIEGVKKVVFREVDYSHYFNDKDGMETAIKYIKTTNLSKKEQLKLIDIINSQFSQLKNEKITYPFIDSMLQNAISQKQNVGIVVYEDGRCIPWLDDDFNRIDSVANKLMLLPPHIKISFTNYLTEFIKDEAKEKYLSKYQLLTDKESEILKAIRRDNVKEVLVKFPEGNSEKPILLEFKKYEKLQKDKIEELANIIGLGQYESIRIGTQNDGSKFIEKIEKKVIK